jgi:hypothetical protein
VSELVSLMLRGGLISEAQAEAVAQHAGSPVARLLAAGALDEDALARFLQRRLAIPLAAADVLASVPERLSRRLDASTAHRFGIVVLSANPRAPATVAIVDPTDRTALRAAGRALGAPAIPAVAPYTPLHTALLRLYGPAPRGFTPRPGPEPPTPPGPERPASAPEPERRWSPKIVSAPATSRSSTSRSVLTPFPLVAEPDPLSPEAFAQVFPRLVTAGDRDAVTQVLLEFLATGFSRVIVFVHSQGELRGRLARGADLDTEAVLQVRIPADEPSSFRSVLERRQPAFGPFRGQNEVDAALAEALGGIDGNVLILPVVLRDRVPLLLFASGSRFPVHPQSLRDLAETASHSLERIITARKPTPTTPPRSGVGG